MTAAAQASATDKPKFTALSENYLDNPNYTPEKLLDALLTRFHLKNDAAISRMLELPPPVVSKVRLKQAQITPAIILRIYDRTGWAIGDIRALMGVTSNITVAL